METYPLDPSVAFEMFNPWRFYCHDESGKWMFRVGSNREAEVWAKLCDATHRRVLHAVMRGNQRLRDLSHGQNVICIFCDGSDRKSVMDALMEIRNLGIEEDLVFKTDEATERGWRNGVGIHEHKWAAIGYRLVSPTDSEIS